MKYWLSSLTALDPWRDPWSKGKICGFFIVTYCKEIGYG